MRIGSFLRLHDGFSRLCANVCAHHTTQCDIVKGRSDDIGAFFGVIRVSSKRETGVVHADD